jgi:hypothetical protein
MYSIHWYIGNFAETNRAVKRRLASRARQRYFFYLALVIH